MVMCVVQNCDIRYGQGVSMFDLPDDLKLWVRKLKTINYWVSNTPSFVNDTLYRHFRY